MFLSQLAYPILALIFLMLFYLLGMYYHRIFKISYSNEPSHLSIFSNIIIGIITVITVYSILITKGHTVSWIYVLLLIFYSFYAKKIKPNSSLEQAAKLNYLQLAVALLFVCALLFAVYLSSVFDGRLKIYTDTFCDYQFYAKTCFFLNKGFESVSQCDNLFLGSTIMPYHYFELWISALIINVLPVSSQIAVSIVTPIILGITAYLGIVSFAKKVSVLSYSIALLLLFFTISNFISNYLDRLGYGIGHNGGLVISVILSYKTYPTFIFMIFALHVIDFRRYELSLILLLFIPITSIALLPTIVPFVLLATTILYFKSNERYELNVFLFFFALYIVLLLLYQFYIWNPLSTNLVFHFSNIFNQPFVLISLKFILCSLPVLALALLLINKSISDVNVRKIVIYSFFTLLLFSFLVVSFLGGSYDIIQFFSNLFIPLLVTFSSLIFIRYQFKKNIVTVLFSIVLLFMISNIFSVKRSADSFRYNKVDPEFVQKVIEELKSEKNVYCGFIHSKTMYSHFYMHSISKVFGIAEIVNLHRNNYVEIGLSDFTALDWLQNRYEGTKLTRNFGLARIPEGTFYKFVEFSKQRNTFKSIADSQLDFIRKCNLTYIYIQNDADIPTQLANHIQLIVSENSKIGYSFYKIRKNV